jgi:hypothetical protein
MACDTHILREVPLFALPDDDERAVLAAQVELKSAALEIRGLAQKLNLVVDKIGDIDDSLRKLQRAPARLDRA